MRSSSDFSEGGDSDSRRSGSTEQHLTIRWTPSHEGVEGSEQADGMARRAAEGEGERAERDYL